MKTRTRARTAWIAALAALLVAGSASAAEVVKVRVGNHPTYTRVVFELDATAGYRIEKQQGAAGSEIRVTLDASSPRFNLDRKTVMVGKVALDASSTGKSVAHIQLRKTPSRVKEMILANPPRIVFDLVFPESQLAAIRQRAAQKKAAAKAASEKPVAVASKSAKTPTPATTPEARPAPTRAKPDAMAKQTSPAQPTPGKTEPVAKTNQPPVAKKTEPVAKKNQPPVAKKNQPPPTKPPATAPIAKQQAPVAPPPATRVEPKQELAAAKPVVEKQTAPAPLVPAPSKASASKPTEASASKSTTGSLAKPGDSKTASAPGATPATQPATRLADQAAQPGAVAKLPGEGDQLAGKPARPAPAAARPTPPAARPGAPAARPGATKTTQPKRAATPAPAAPQPGGGIDWMLWGGIASGTLLLAVIAVIVMRRRSLPNDLDVTAVAEGQSSEGAIPEGGFSMEESPAESPFEAPPMTESFPDVAPAAAPEVESRPAEVDIAAGPGLFDDEDPEKENERMDLENSGMEQTASEMPTQLGGGAVSAGDADVSRLVGELERRMAQVETRLDEATEARERLERQVAAQAEELRVQRAAIARTQRALRSLNRPAEEQATEPAIREPSA